MIDILEMLNRPYGNLTGGERKQVIDEITRLRDGIARLMIAIPQAADELGFECEGCGHLCGNPERDLEIIRKAGSLSCCPERKMRPLSVALREKVEERMSVDSTPVTPGSKGESGLWVQCCPCGQSKPCGEVSCKHPRIRV